MDLGDLGAAAVAAAVVACMVGLAVQIMYLLTLARAAGRCDPRNRRLSPGQVWLCLIPLFGLVWQFFVVFRLAAALRREFSARGGAPGAEEDYGRRLGLAACILLPASGVPLAGVVCGIAGLACWILYWVKIAGYSRRLAPPVRRARLEEAVRQGERWLVLLVLVAGFGASYAQRISLSLVLPAARRELAFSATQTGWALSAFLFGLLAGYVCMTVVTALAGTRWGLTASLAGASLAAAASGLASGVGGLIAARLLLGFFTGGLLPGTVQAAREWFPARLRPLVIGGVLTTAQAAMAAVPPVVAQMSGWLPWRTVLLLTAAPTLAAAVLCAAAWPTTGRRVARWHIAGPGYASAGMLGLGLLLTAPLSSASSTWLPMYLRERAGAGLAAIGGGMAGATIAGAAGALLAGFTAWAAISSGCGVARTRAALLTACGCLLPAVALAGSMHDALAVMALAAISAAAYQGWCTLLYSAVADALPARLVAAGAALGALLSGLGSTLASGVAGRLVGSSGFPAMFLAAGVAALAGFAVVVLLAWVVPQDPEEPDEAEGLKAYPAGARAV